MKIFSAKQIQEIDRLTIESEGIDSVDLMERAASLCFDWISGNTDADRPVCILSGMGNNGGDGLAIARMLIEAGRKVNVYQIRHRESMAPDAQINAGRLESMGVPIIPIQNLSDLPQPEANGLVVDAILGSGLNQTLKGKLADVVQTVNAWQCEVVSIDIPTGLFCDAMPDVKPGIIIRATHTLSFQFPKRSFLTPKGGVYVGTFHLLDIGLKPEGLKNTDVQQFYTVEEDIKPLRKARGVFSHKGDYGCAFVVGGSYGMMGSIALSARAAARIGSGITIAQVPQAGQMALQSNLPEAICYADKEQWIISKIDIPEKATAIGIGPGLGKDRRTAKALIQRLEKLTLPLVLDADALNLVSETGCWDKIPDGAILTPHLGEFERMAGKKMSYDEAVLTASQWATRHRHILILKGRYSAICLSDGSIHFNSSGHPCMAKGGSGDVLTGILTGLLAQGYLPETAAKVGVYLHGEAGEKAVNRRREHAVLATDIVEEL